MKLTIVTRNGELIAYSVGNPGNNPEAFVASLLTKAKAEGFLIVGKKALIWDNVINVGWE